MSKDVLIAPTRKLTELAEFFGVHRQNVYTAFEKGRIGGVVQVGRLRLMYDEAFLYHCQHGYGSDVKPWKFSKETDAARPANGDDRLRDSSR